MNTGTNYADIFYSESVNDATALEKNVKDNPASAIARFLLLYHYKKNNDPGFEKFAKQSSLYFNNPYWLQLQLLQTDLKNQESLSIKSELTEETGQFAVVLPEDKIDVEENKKEIIPAEEGNENIGSIEPVEEINNGHTTKQEILPSESPYEKIERSQTIDNSESSGFNKEDLVAFEPKEEELEMDQLNNDAPYENIKEESLAFEPKEEISETHQPVELINNDLPVEEINEENIPLESKDENIEKLRFDNSNSFTPTQAGEELPAFEPLHTVDYFASQGIKIKEEALMNDKLGKQMKSFTEWLKSMKKLHPGKLPEQNEVIEKIIQSSAEESNADAHVLTEAMAEVLIKQNKEEKAIEMYQKLSLLNPSKSAYFAAKIESLKTN